jgi:hypothetical protein
MKALDRLIDAAEDLADIETARAEVAQTGEDPIPREQIKVDR